MIKLGGKVKSQARNVSFSLKNGGLSGEKCYLCSRKAASKREQSKLTCSAEREQARRKSMAASVQKQAGTKVIKEILSWQYQLQTYQY